jgi:hypothetical protein
LINQNLPEPEMACRKDQLKLAGDEQLCRNPAAIFLAVFQVEIGKTSTRISIILLSALPWPCWYVINMINCHAVVSPRPLKACLLTAFITDYRLNFNYSVKLVL